MRFENVKLGDYLYIKGRIGWKGLKKEEYLQDGKYRIINGESLTTNGIDWSKAGFITKERYDESPEIMLQEHDILISKDGTIGKIGYVERVEQPTTVASGIFVIRNLKPEIIDTRFIYYFFFSRFFRDFIITRTEGSVIPHLYQKDFVELNFPLPQIHIQHKIVSILDEISRKIDLNKRENQNLEQQTQTLFKSWFIDLEPFGKAVPAEWEYHSLGSVTSMGAGGDKPKDVSPVKNDYCQYPVYSNGLINDGLYGYTSVPKINQESVTVSARGTIGFVCLRHIPYVPIVRLISLTPDDNYLSAKYLYLYLKQLNITGTGTTQQQLTVPDFRKTELLIPDMSTMNLFTNIVTPIFNKIWANEEENQVLADLRDTLLPRLMSGELDVSTIDIYVGKF